MLFDVSVAVRSSTTNTKSETTGRRYSTSMERRSRGGSLTRKAAEIMSGDDPRDELEGTHGDGGVGIHAELLLASEADQVLVPAVARDVRGVHAELHAPVELQRLALAGDGDLGRGVRSEV